MKTARFLSFVICFVFITVVWLPLQTQSQKDCDDDILDSCAQQVFIYGDRNHTFGRNREEVLSRCQKSKDAESCVRNYVRKCYKNPLIKQYFQILMRGPSSVLKRSCTKQGVRDVIRHHQCLKSSKGPLDDCTDEAIIDMVRVSKAKESSWLPASCCFVSKAKACSLKAVESSCRGESLQYIKKAMKDFNGDTFDLACGDNFDHQSDKCKAIIAELPVLPPGTKQPKSILSVTLLLMSQFLE